MGTIGSGAVLRQIEAIYGGGSVTGLTDAQLLERFASRTDELTAEAAFAALVARHGPMVLGLCRRRLRDEADAEDAFQATFLVLARRAGAVRVDDSLGRWLAGVARRVADRARKRSSTRPDRPGPTLPPDLPADGPGPLDDALGRERRDLVRDEVDHLPAPYREAVVLCHLEGRSLDEAAAHLRWPIGTVKGRLHRARALLRDRLDRRGVTPTLLPVVPAALLHRTVAAALRFTLRNPAAGAVPAAVAALAEGTLAMMTWTKVQTAGAALLSLGATAALAAGFAIGTPGDGPRSDAPTVVAGGVDNRGQSAKNASGPATASLRAEQRRALLEAADAAMQAPDDHEKVYTLHSIAAAEVDAGMREQGRETYRAAVRAAGRLENLIQRRAALGRIGLSQREDGFQDDAMQTIGAIENEIERANTLQKYAQQLAFDGKFDEALRVLGSIPDGSIHEFERAAILYDIAVRQMRAGDFEGALSTAGLIEDGASRRQLFAGVAKLRALQEGGVPRDLIESADSSLARSEALLGVANGLAERIKADPERAVPAEATEPAPASPDLTDDRPTRPTGDPAEPIAERPEPPATPRELHKTTLPEYVVEPPDLIRVEVLEALSGRPITGERLVRPDGKITLDFYGEVYVAGLTPLEIKEKVVEHLRQHLSDEALGLVAHDPETGQTANVPARESDRVFVDVVAYNSKFYYVKGDVAMPGRFPITGSETVLDAINLAGLLPTADARRIRLIRPAEPGEGGPREFAVDLNAIVEGGDPTTNYQLKPGDRLIVERRPEADPGFLRLREQIGEVDRRLDQIRRTAMDPDADPAYRHYEQLRSDLVDQLDRLLDGRVMGHDPAGPGSEFALGSIDLDGAVDREWTEAALRELEAAGIVAGQPIDADQLREAVVLIARLANPSGVQAAEPARPAVPRRRVEELLEDAEGLRMNNDAYDRFWFLDEPAHLNPFRTGIGPTPTPADERIEQRLAAIEEALAVLAGSEESDAEAASFTVSGEVGSPGQFNLSADLRVSEALRVAGGLNETAGTTVYLLRRGEPFRPILLDPDRPDQIPAERDEPLRRGDQIVVPRWVPDRGETIPLRPE